MGILLGPSFPADEIHLQTKIGANADRPRDDLSMFSGDPYQESVELPEPAFQLVGWYIYSSVARPVIPLLVGL